MRALALLLSLGLAAATGAQTFVEAARAAVEAAPEGTPQQRRALLAQARVLQRYDLMQCAEAAGRALAAARAHGDRETEALALALQAQCLAATEGRAACFAALEAAAAALPAAAGQAVQARLEHAFALAHQRFGETPDGLVRLRRAIDAAEAAADAPFAAVCRLAVFWILGFPDDDATPEIERVAAALDGAADAPERLRARLLQIYARRNYGIEPDAQGALSRLADDAAVHGDRAVEAMAARMVGQIVAASDLDSAWAWFERCAAAARALGDRELIGFADQALAECAVRRGDAAVADAAITRSIAAFEALGITRRLLSALQTALRAASLAGDDRRVRAVGERIVAMEREVAARQNQHDSARYWRDASELRSEAREAERAHRQQVEALQAAMVRVTWIAGGTVILLLSLVCAVLFAGRRRLARFNQRLEAQIRDTDRVRAEREALQHNLGQIERLDSLGVLAGGVAHDFNNLLAVVKGNAELLLRNRQLGGADREGLDQIVRAANSAAGLCQDILTYARADSGAPVRTDLREVLRGLVPLARAGFGAGVQVEVELGDEPAWVRVDRSQIEQVFLNVLVNAGEAVGPRGQIRVRVSAARLDGTPPSGHWFGDFTGEPRDCVAVSVRDTGQGMDAETIRRVFDPFFSTRFPGRGLGLAVTFAVLRRHRGVVQIESVPGEGSTFTVFLSRAAATEADEVPASPAAPPSAPRTVSVRRALIVDDEPAVAQVARRMLEAEGVEVVVVGDGDAALRVLEHPPADLDLVLLDYTMPDRDGRTLLQDIRARNPSLPVVMMSGHDEGLVRGMVPDCPFLQKPFDLAAVHDLLARVSALSAVDR
ncbi:MAG: response regulator [Planctomycetota bacterium]